MYSSGTAMIMTAVTQPTTATKRAHRREMPERRRAARLVSGAWWSALRQDAPFPPRPRNAPDDLSPMRGVAISVLLGVLLWVALGLALWWLFGG